MSDKSKNNRSDTEDNVIFLSNFINHNSAPVNSEFDNSEDFLENTSTALPTPLVLYQRKLLCISGIILVGALFFSFHFRNYAPLILLLGSAYMLFKACLVQRHFLSGQIVELGAVCTGVSVSKIKDRIHVTFRTAAEEDGNGEPGYLKFAVPMRSSQDDFIVDAPYVIYFDQTNPHSLIASVQV